MLFSRWAFLATLLSNSTEENNRSIILNEMNQQNLAGEPRGSGMGAHEDLMSFPADAPDNEAPKSLQRPPNKPPNLTWQCIGLSSRPTTHKLNLQEWRQISAKMSPLSAVDVQKRHQKETQKLSYPSSLLWLNVCISGVFSLFVVLFLFHFRVFYFLLFHLFIHVLPFHGCSLDR